MKFAALVVLSASAAMGQGSAVQGDFADAGLLQARVGGYFAYRIPAAVAARGQNVALFLEGRRTSLSDFGWIDLLSIHSRDGGRTWSKVRVVSTEGGPAEKITMGNPCPVFDSDTGRLWCVFTRENQQVFAVFSDDDGESWSRPREITAEVRPILWTHYWTGPGHGLQLQHGPKRGRLVLPSYHLELESNDGGETCTSTMRSHMVYSDDHGRTWKFGQGTRAGPGLDISHSHISGAWIPGEASCQGGECMAQELPDGRLYLISRNEAHDRLEKLFAWSSDGGESWTPLQREPQLPDPGCQGSILSHPNPSAPDTCAVLVAGISSDHPDKEHPFHFRQRLALRASADGCRTWREARVIHAGAAAYCDLVALPAGNFLCVYEGGDRSSNESIRIARFNWEWVRVGLR